MTGRTDRAERRRELDQLGDLFFSRRTPPPPAPQTPNDGLRDLVSEPAPARQRPAPDPAPEIAVTAILAGGLPPERRAALARRAVRRLSAGTAGLPVVTFGGAGAAAATMANGEVALLGGDVAWEIGRMARESGRLVIVLAEPAATYLAAGRRLPESCTVLVTPDDESLVEAYRELKTAAAATSGPVPEILVVAASSETQAERTYRRLARVAIAHLECTPTFAGHCLETADVRGNETGGEDDTVDANLVWRAIDPMLAASSAEPPGATPTVADAPAPAVEVAQPEDERHDTLPPVAGVVKVQPHSPPVGTAFTVWQPASTEELLDAAGSSIAGLLPHARGLLDPEALADIPDRPDALAVDRDGRPVAVVLADGRSAESLGRAVRAHEWLAAHARLLARAFPQAGLDPQPGTARCVVVAPEGAAKSLEPLCPPHVALSAYTPVACGATRGLLFRQILWPIGGPAESSAASAEIPAAPQSAAGPVTVAPRTVAETSAGCHACPAGMDEHSRGAWLQGSHATPDDYDDPGTSPDDDLSADEINDLKGSFEIDELT